MSTHPDAVKDNNALCLYKWYRRYGIVEWCLSHVLVFSVPSLAARLPVPFNSVLFVDAKIALLTQAPTLRAEAHILRHVLSFSLLSHDGQP